MFGRERTGKPCSKCGGPTSTMWQSVTIRLYRCDRCSITTTDDGKPIEIETGKEKEN